MEKIEVLAENNTQSALNTLIEKTLDGEEKMEEDLGFLFDNNASQKKKQKNKKKTKTAGQKKNLPSKKTLDLKPEDEDITKWTDYKKN